MVTMNWEKDAGDGPPVDRVLADLHHSGVVTFDEAASHAIDRENFQRLVKGY